MVASAKYPIDYAPVYGSTLIKPPKTGGHTPVKTFAGTPPSQFQQQTVGFASQFNAVDSMVCKSTALSALRLPSC